MKKIQLNQKLFTVLYAIDKMNSLTKNQKPTTKELETELLSMNKEKFQQIHKFEPTTYNRATFFRYFKLIKEEGLLASRTNENHEVVWMLNESGQKYIKEYRQMVLKPIHEIMAVKQTQEDKELLLKFFSKWVDFNAFRKETQDNKWLCGQLVESAMHYENFFDMFDVKIKLSEDKIKKFQFDKLRKLKEKK